jgi:hypothetical protein
MRYIGRESARMPVAFRLTHLETVTAFGPFNT